MEVSVLSTECEDFPQGAVSLPPPVAAAKAGSNYQRASKLTHSSPLRKASDIAKPYSINDMTTNDIASMWAKCWTNYVLSLSLYLSIYLFIYLSIYLYSSGTLGTVPLLVY